MLEREEVGEQWPREGCLTLSVARKEEYFTVGVRAQAGESEDRQNRECICQAMGQTAAGCQNLNKMRRMGITWDGNRK